MSAYLDVAEQEARRTDLNFARLMALLANINRKPNSKAYKPKDFMPDQPRAKPKRRMSDEEMSSIARQIVAHHNRK